jgi:uncharacterized membrane protein
MDIFVFLVLLALAFPVIAIVALITALSLRSSFARLDTRLRALEAERAMARTAALTAAAEPTQAPRAAAPPQPAIERSAQPVPQTPRAAETPPASPATTVPAVAAAPPPPLPPHLPPPIPPGPPASPTPPRAIGFEERVGTRWVVWVGGVALALGGIFLVSYTIQQGLIGPHVRIALAAMFAAALVAAGEWTRRKAQRSGLPSLPVADIPSILTAAGTIAAYATVYAAYALYNFLPPGAAFILLGVVAILTLAAALLHGPALAGLGVVGAFVTPLLVASEQPDYWSLYIYLAVVTGAAFALARARLWLWLAVTAIVLGASWAIPGADVFPVEALGAHVFHALAGFVLAAVLLVCGLLYGPEAKAGEVDWLSTLALSAYLLVAAALVLASRHDPVAFTAFVALTVATLAIAWRTEAATGAVPVAGILAVAVIADWAVPMNLSNLIAPAGPAAPAIEDPQRYNYGSHFFLAALWAAMFGIGGFLAQGRSTRALVPMLWSACAVCVPLAMLIALYYRIAGLDRSLPFAGLALLLAAIFGVATEALVQRAPRPGLPAAGAIFATGTLAALALALTFALEKGWLTVALALMAPAAAWIAEKRPLPALRTLAAVMVAVTVARVGYEPRIVGDELGTTPIFNWLLYGYGVPALAFWVAGWLLRRRADDLAARIADAGAILFTVLLVMLQIRHYCGSGDIYRPMRGVAETALGVNAGLALTIGLERIRGRTGSIVHNVGALILAALTLIGIVFAMFSVADPRFAHHAVRGVFFNSILLGYGTPAVLAIILALIARTTRPMPYRIVAATTAVILALFYLTLETRRLFHGPILAGPTSDAEQYCYSTVWLVFGIALLAVGFFLRSQPARFLALGVITATIAKVFIVDTASISGIYRALSVIGLGVVLLGIGWLYQRLLYPRTPTAAAAAPTE